MKYLIAAAVLLLCTFPLQAYGQELTVSVDLGATVHRMASGVGASWHAMEDSLPFDGRTTHGGSAWGANPDPDDEEGWQQVYRHAGWLGLDFCRVELERRIFEPERRQFTWDSREMRILYRILDWCQQRGADVFLQQMWCNVDWLAYPEFRGDPVKRVHSAPADLDDFAYGLGALAEHLVRDKGYTCIKWLCLSNEPGWDWSWWQMPPNNPAPFAPALQKVRAELDRRGLRELPLSGPDWTDTPALEPEKIDFDPYIGAYDIHTYYSRYDWQSMEGLPVDLPLSLVQQRLADWAAWAHQRGKPFFLTEVGSMAFGWRTTNPGPNTLDAALKDVQMVVRGMNVGVDGFNKWSFLNRGDLDGQWQLLKTWDVENRRLLERFEPQPNSYFYFGLVSRFTAPGSRVAKVEVAGGELEGIARVTATALESPAGELTILVVNDAPQPWSGRLVLTGISGARTFHAYQLDPSQADDPALRIEPLESFTLSGDNAELSGELPPRSVTVLSTVRLGHDDPGMTGK